MLNNAQLLVLKNFIASDPVLSLKPHNGDGAFETAFIMNGLASPDFWVWKTSVTKAEAVQSVSVDGTTFIWAGNGFITRSVGEQAAWKELFEGGSCNPSLANVRQAFSDIFSGAGSAASNRAHLLAIGRRKATIFEKLFATGTGSTGSPGLLVVEGNLSAFEVEAAWDAV